MWANMVVVVVCVCVCFFGFLWPVSGNFWRGGMVVVSEFLCFFFLVVANAQRKREKERKRK